MLTIVAIVLAVTVLDGPWRFVAIATGLVLDLGENVVLFKWSRRRRAAVGAEALVGAAAIVTRPCRPEGQVRVNGELWRAVCDEGADPGTEVVVRAVSGLTLTVSLRDLVRDEVP